MSGLERTDLIARLHTVIRQTSENINCKDEYGAALIHYVVALNLHEVVDYLLERGADQECMVGSSRLNPSIIAYLTGHIEMLSAL